MSNNAPEYGIIVHCHLRWDFVWQRPQHIMSRLSKSHPILFLEDYAPLPPGPDSDGQPRFDIKHVSDTLTVARPLFVPHIKGDTAGNLEVDKRNGEAWLRLLNTTVHGLGWKNVVHWFYTPMASGARTMYDPVAVAYDCMDELANFKNAPKNIKQRELDLMDAADLIFTGGPSMYQARKDNYPNVYQFNSGVDVEHFRKAQASETEIPADIAHLPHPVLLYYGVIDERMGWDNLAAVADAHPEWSIVMVGPLAKIGEADLLRRPNIYYTGQRGYDDLPGYLKGSHVTLVPFALSDATRFLSPTKTLEYFAAEKPVVSTPIQDIVTFYPDAARIAETPAEFVRACEAALAESETAERIAAGVRHAEAQTWDAIVAQMRDLLDNAVTTNLSKKDEATMQNASNETSLATGQVRWYSGSRGAGAVETDDGDEVMTFMPAEAQTDLGPVREGDTVAVGHVGPAAHTTPDLFPLDLDKSVSSEKE